METRAPARKSEPIDKGTAVLGWRRLSLLVLLTVAVGACTGASAGSPSTTVAPTPVSNTSNGARVVNVPATEMRFGPNAIVAHAGQPVELTLTNQGRMVHDLSRSDEVAQPVKILVQSGHAGNSTFTFERPGTHTFTCSQPGHTLLGMKGTITVE
jgi:uncharacterized cupredoxin-like copper-binding protein